MRNGTCELVRSTSRPSSSSQPSEPCVSSWAWLTRWVRQVPATVTADAARAASTSPPKPAWSAAITLRPASSTRSSGVRSGMQQRSAGGAGLLGVEDRGQHLVVDPDAPACLLGSGGRRRDDGRDALADEPHDVVEHPGVVGVVGAVLVACGGEAGGRDVLVREHELDALDVARGIVVSIERMRAWACGAREHAQMQRTGHRRVERVGLGPCHDAPGGRRFDRTAHERHRRVLVAGGPEVACAAPALRGRRTAP